MRVPFLVTSLALAMSPMGHLQASGTPERIEVRSRFAFVVCTGFCVDDTVIVLADGNVFWQLENPWDGPRGPRKHYRVAPAAVAEFMRQMNAIRPDHDQADPVGCDADLHIPGVWDWDIRWIDANGQVQLLTCERQRTFDAWRAAIKAIGIPNGPIGTIDPTVLVLPDDAP